MAYKITEDCMMCGVCEANCTAKAIKEIDGTFIIVNKFCVLCDRCIENCPVNAIKEV